MTNMTRKHKLSLHVDVVKRVALLAPATFFIALFLFLPLSLVITYSFLEKAQFGGVIWKFSLAAYEQLAFEHDIFTGELSVNLAYAGIILRSLLHAISATVLCALVGVPMAYYIATLSPRHQSMMLLLITVPYWVNLLVRTVSMLFIIRNEGPLNTFLIWLGLILEPLHIAYTNTAIQIGLVYSYLPFMVLPIYAAVERFDFRLLEAAHDLYAGRWTALVTVLIPAIAPGIVAGAILVFIPCIGAYIAPDLLGGGKELMIGNTIALQFQSSRNWPFGASLSVILMSIVLIALFLLARMARHGKGHKS